MNFFHNLSFFQLPQRTQAVILHWSLTSSSMSCLPTRICNSWQSIIRLSYMYWPPLRYWDAQSHLRDILLTLRELMASWVRNMCSWITNLQLGNACRGHSRSSAFCNQVQASCRQNSSARFLPLMWNQTPCFRCESIVPNKYVILLQSFDRRMLGKGSTDT